MTIRLVGTVLLGCALVGACRDASSPAPGSGTGAGGSPAGTGGSPVDPGMAGSGDLAASSSCNDTGAGPSSVGVSVPPPPSGGLSLGATTTLPVAPPAVSGGTLLVLTDGHTVVAADPDRDQVYLVDLTTRTLTATVSLETGDEPGRIVEDGRGLAHVALRRGGGVVTIDPVTASVTARQAVCAAPRGIAYDPATDLLHVACADGELVSLPAAGGDPIRTLALRPDLRDVVVQGDHLRVSRFRSAELLTVDGDGNVSAVTSMPSFRSVETRGGQLFTPAVAWRTVGMPGGGVAMVHQRGCDDEVQHGNVTPGGYGGGNSCNAIVQTAVTVVSSDGSIASGPALGNLPVAVDLAVSPDGVRIALVSAANAHGTRSPVSMSQSVYVTSTSAMTSPVTGCMPNSGRVSCGSDVFPAGSTARTCYDIVPPVVGEAIAVAFAPDGSVMVQSREPAVLNLPNGTTTGLQISLSTSSRGDTGHTLFHVNAGAALACASCHAEGQDDGRVWNFACAGKRRTQSLQVGLRGTEPFHWNGDEKDFPQLTHDVFTTRMSGPELAGDQIEATLSWIDAQPRRLRAAAADPAAVARGQTLFNSATCATCHGGEHLTNNQTTDVGTGGKFQVPSLVGIANHAPFMHNGCAATLADRFSPACGGGDRHGVTSKLTANEIGDLVRYLETL